jgi:hypothetical protein
MKREDLEHVLRAAARVVEDDLVVIGSQAVLAQHPDAPEALLRSMEVDLYPRHKPERSEEIDGAIGDGSRFHETYAYYAHGVGPETFVAPAGWDERLIRLEVQDALGPNAPAVAWCLEVHDLALAKLAAGRSHDYEFVEEAVRAGLLDEEQLGLGVDLLPASHQGSVRDRLAGILRKVRVEPRDPV